MYDSLRIIKNVIRLNLVRDTTCRYCHVLSLQKKYFKYHKIYYESLLVSLQEKYVTPKAY